MSTYKQIRESPKNKNNNKETKVFIYSMMIGLYRVSNYRLDSKDALICNGYMYNCTCHIKISKILQNANSFIRFHGNIDKIFCKNAGNIFRAKILGI